MVYFSYCRVIVFFLCGLGACTSLPNREQDFRETRIELAVSFEQQGRYADALLQWQALRLVFPADEYIEQQISVLEATIEQRVAALREQITSLDNKDKKKAHRLYLQWLALQPDNLEALAKLRGFEKTHVQRAANLKTAKNKKKYAVKPVVKQQEDVAQTRIDDYLAAADRLHRDNNSSELLQLTDRFLRDYPEHTQALDYRFKALVQLAEQAAAAGQLEKAVELFEVALSVPGIGAGGAVAQRNRQLRQNLSTDYYRKAMKRFNHNIDQAVAYLQTSVEYDPQNFKARRQLERARRIQQNLKLIESPAK